MRGVPFNEAIGSVLWPAVVSRPDVAFAVGVLLQFIQNPGPAHWEALKWVIVYLGATSRAGIRASQISQECLLRSLSVGKRPTSF